MTLTDIVTEFSHRIMAKTGREETIKMELSEDLYFDVYTEVQEMAKEEGKYFPLIPLDTAILNTGFGRIEMTVMRKQ